MREMSNIERDSVSGGLPVVLLWVEAIAMAAFIYDAGKDFAAGYNDAVNGK